MRETRVRATGAQQRPSREVHRGPASVRLVYQEALRSVGKALAREDVVKQLTRVQKEVGRQLETTPPRTGTSRSKL
jgi:predicted GIY-YIG superfamily endonuclease